MAGRDSWVPLPLGSKLFQNIDEDATTRAHSALENAWIGENDGVSRFPGLRRALQLPGDTGRVYLSDYAGDLIAGTSQGRLFRIDRSLNAHDVTRVPIAGGGRIIFSQTPIELHMAAGAEVIRFDGVETSVLSTDAPLSTHVGYIDDFVLATEKDSGRFQHTELGDYDNWDPLDTFAADGNPDNITSMVINEFREVMLCGPDSIEQFERLPNGSVPFFRRWSVAEGVKGAYTSLFADNALIVLTERSEVARVSGQVITPISDDINRMLAKVDDWTDAWFGGFPDEELFIGGQKFILLQAPFATTPYGTKGLTWIYDYRKKIWSNIYGWDSDIGAPARWPGWSYWPLWDRTFVGGDGGVIYEFDDTIYNLDSMPMRWLVRTAHYSDLGELCIENMRLRVKRGVGTYNTEPVLRVRCNVDNKGFGRWVHVGLGKAGKRDMIREIGGFGCGHSFQFEIECTDDCPVELVKADVQVGPVGF